MQRPTSRPLRLARIGTIVFSLFATSSFAYDLADAYVDALGNDAQLASARANLQAAREQIPLARAGVLPSAGASASLLRNYSDTNVGASTSYNSQSYGAQLSYPLYDPAARVAVDQAQLNVQAVESQFAAAEQDLILRVATAYFDVLAASDDLRTIQAQKRAIAEQLAAAKRNFEVGTATITDQQEAQARFDLTVAQELASINALEVRRAALATLTGKPIPPLHELPPGVALMPPEPTVESAWTERARSQNPQVAQARFAAAASEQEIERQRYARYPTVDAVGRANYARNPSAQFRGIDSTTIGAGLELAIPLYTGGAIPARVRQAAANRDRAASEVVVAQRGAEQAARQTYLSVVSGLRQVQALEEAEKSSKLALESNRLGYEVGVRIIIDVLNAQQQLFSTQRDLARARYDVLVNGLRLQSTTGGLGPDEVKRVSALLQAPTTPVEAAPADVQVPSAAPAPRRPAPPVKPSRRSTPR